MSVKITILGLLIEGDKHPYAIQQTIKERMMDHYLKLQKGSLYYTVEKLHNEKHIEVVSIITEENTPDKTIYRITDKGRQLFHSLLLKQLVSGENNYRQLNPAITFMEYLKKEELIEALTKRVDFLETKLLELKSYYEQFVGSVPKFALHIIAEGYGFYKVERDLFKGLLNDVENDSLQRFESLDYFVLD